MKIKEIVRVTCGRLLSGDPDTDIDPACISTDSRTIRKGQLFLGLSGANFDGNDFVKNALKKGAAGAILTAYSLKLTACKKIIICVKDTTKALQDIAAAHRSKFSIPVIAVTGSNGKTTVKDMIWSVLSARYNVLKNEGTHNNHIGVPQTLLKLKSHHDICVLELGANHKGEIRLLSGIARPSMAVITNIGPSHLAFLEDLRGVYEAKKEILENLDRKKGVLILNGDDKFLAGIRSGKFKMIRFGMNGPNDFKARVLSMEGGKIKFILRRRQNRALKGADRYAPLSISRRRMETPAFRPEGFIVNDDSEFELKLLGLHNVYNALAAIVAGSQFGLDDGSMKRALADYKPPHMRMDLEEVKGIGIINDSYNSNPLSMRCALEALRSYPAKARWVVAGDMLELGRQAVRLHKNLGGYIAGLRIEGLLTFGRLSKYTLSEAIACGMKSDKLWHCSSHGEIARILRRFAKKGDVVLLKGSRAMAMEKVLEKL